MKTDELREKYLQFFETKNHTRCESDVLVPTWDPSVLFTPAGMNQFKDHFLGKTKLTFTKATSCQKCLRTGDIDNVGRTAYHHTFFEMLGNFSFGDYFKREAIHWAWEFLTESKWLGLPADKLTVTVYQDDDEASDIWHKEIGLSLDRIQRLGEHDNFWPAGAPTDGPDGVCGPCSEIFYHPAEGQEVEIWNLVFTQFNRVGNPPDNLRPLPSKNIDTGMGLERCAAVLQGKVSNYEIDILKPVVEAAAQVCGFDYQYGSDNGRRARRIADHVRACTMSVHENVYPGPQKEKYVIRRLLRRAVLDGHQMGQREPFLFQIVPEVVQQMKTAYPELSETVTRVQDVIKNEESNFFGTIDDGLDRVERIFNEMKSANRTSVDGTEVADLYQTYGVPPEVFEAMAAEQGLAFDWDGFHAAMVAHGEASGKLSHAVMDAKGPVDTIKRAGHETTFVGYTQTEADAEIKFIIADGTLVDELEQTGQAAPVTLVLDTTPFYGESGGQVGDHGSIANSEFHFIVTDTQKDASVFLHHGYLDHGKLTTGTPVKATVDTSRRDAIRRAHSATHVLHYALQKNLGSHAQQQGSKVDEDWLRFDFTNMTPVDTQLLATIEQDVHAQVNAKQPIQWNVVPLAKARADGAMMLFGEKYPDPVRMVSMGNFSKELCGGTHLDNTSQVGEFEITLEEGVASGTRRIVALTGDKAAEHGKRTREELVATAEILGAPVTQAAEAVKTLLQRVRDLKKQISSGTARPLANAPTPSESSPTQPTYAEVKTELKKIARTLNAPLFEVAQRTAALQKDALAMQEQIAQWQNAGDAMSAESLIEKAAKVAGADVIIQEIPGGNSHLMRQLIDQIRKKTESSAIFLVAAHGDDKVTMVAGVSRDLVQKGASAGNWVKEVAPIVGGGGGGKPDMAQAGGKNPEKLPDALQQARQYIDAILNA